MRLSSLENAAPETLLSCLRAKPICAPVEAFHNRALSTPQVRMRLSSFENTAPKTLLSCLKAGPI
jgi:hypothetical protein